MELTGLLILIATINAIYFLPAIIASSHTNDYSVLLVNLFFGWTFIGWVIALIMSTSSKRKKELVDLIKFQNKEIDLLQQKLNRADSL